MVYTKRSEGATSVSKTLYQTVAVVAAHGFRMEANAIMRMLMAECSYGGLWGIKAIVLMAVLACRRRLTLRVFRVATLGMALIVLSNALTTTAIEWRSDQIVRVGSALFVFDD